MKHPFQSARLEYRAMEESDDEFMHELSTNPTSYAQSNTDLLRPPPRSWSANLRKVIAEKALLGVILYLKPEEGKGVVKIGHLVLMSSADGEEVRHHRNADLGIDIKEEYQGQGYGTEAIKWTVNWGFMTAGLHRINITCFAWNEGAGRLYERCGFVPEGRRREVAYFDGKWMDILEFGILDREWMAKGEVVKLMEDVKI